MLPRGMIKALISLVFAALLATLSISQSAAAIPAPDISGNTYTSPTYGYTVTWDDTWFAVEETSEAGYDMLGIADDVGFVEVDGFSGFAGNAQFALAAAILDWGRAEGISNFRPMTNSEGAGIRGGDERRAYGEYAFTRTFEDGTSAEFVTYFDVRTLVPGESVLAVVGGTLIENYDYEMPRVRAIADEGITIPVVLVKGEPAPVFVAGAWRIAVASAVVAEKIAAAGLKAREGKEWLLVIADVTNFSANNDPFDPTQLKARDETGQAYRLAPGSTPGVAKRLELQPANKALVVAIGPGESSRVVLVFQVKAGVEELSLVQGDNALPLTDVLTVSFDPNELPPSAGPPDLAEAVVLSAVDGSTLEIQLTTESTTAVIHLLGVDAPSNDETFAAEAVAHLSELEGITVLIEADDELKAAGPTGSRYAWVEQVDGTRVLLNQHVIVEGFGRYSTLPAKARFAAWLSEAERLARTEQVGLWSTRETAPGDGAQTTLANSGGLTSHVRPALFASTLLRVYFEPPAAQRSVVESQQFDMAAMTQSSAESPLGHAIPGVEEVFLQLPDFKVR